jgi:hypothetical protein
LDTSITNNKQQNFFMINQQDSPENSNQKTSPEHRRRLAGKCRTSSELQNWPETHRTGRQYLKTEQNTENRTKTVTGSSPESRRSLTGVLSETTKLVGIRQTTPEISITTTTDPIDDYKTAIQHQLSCSPNKQGFPATTYVTSGSHFRHQTLQTRPAKQHDRPPKTNIFFPTGRCSGLHKTQTKKKKTATEIYEGTARVG